MQIIFNAVKAAIILILFCISFYPQLAYCLDANSKAVIYGRPAFSPDGKWLAVSIAQGDNSFLYKLNWPRGKSDLTRLTQAKEGYELSPAFSPDAKKIVYCYALHGRGLHAKLLVADLTTGTVSPLLNSNGDHDSAPIFSKDGKEVYFVRTNYYGQDLMSKIHAHTWDVYRVNVDGAGLKPISKGKFYGDGSLLTLSPDGTKLAFTDFVFTLSSGESADERQFIHGKMIYILSGEDFKTISMLGPQLAKLDIAQYFRHPYSRANPGPQAAGISVRSVSSPCFTLNGKEILFLHGSTELYSMDLQTCQCSKLFNLPNDIIEDSMVFSPDGSCLVFALGGPNWIGSADGSGKFKLRDCLKAMDLKTQRIYSPL